MNFKHIIRPRRLALPLLLMLSALTGCAHRATSPTGEYATVGAAPRRDADVARAENERALDLMKSERGIAPAESALRRALEADVMFGPAHNSLGLIYYRRNELYKAAWEFQYAIKLMPNQPEPRNNLGLVFESACKLDQALQSYADATKLAPDEPQFVGNLARAHVRKGDRDPEVRALLEHVVSIDPRPQWVAWASERLALMHPPDATEPAVPEGRR